MPRRVLDRCSLRGRWLRECSVNPTLLRRALAAGYSFARRSVVSGRTPGRAPDRPRSRRTAAAACALLAFSGAARSADERVVITATRSPQASDAVIADLVVIDAEQIEHAGPIGLAELLQRHAGAELSATGGPGQVSGVFLRGSNTNHVVVLVDGVRINSASAGTNALEHLPLAQIERIEVLRGPASSLYGADAIGGVIQIFTRNTDGVSGRASVGSDRLREFNAGVGSAAGDTQWSLNAGTLDVRAFSATNAANPFSFNPDADPYRDNHVNARLQQRWAEGHRITLRGLVSSASTHFDAGLGSDDVNRQRITSFAAESEDQFTSAWRSTVRLARGSDHQRSEGGAFPSRFDTDQDQVTWQNDLRFGVTDIVLGADWRREEVSSDTAFTQTSRHIGALFAGASTRLDALQLEGSLRTDRNSQFGSHTTGRFGAGWAFNPAWRVSAAAGTAFHAPTFNDLYFPLSFGFSGNPNLKPERSRGFDAALRYRSGGTAFNVAAFTNRIVDLISVDPTFSTVINVNRARIRGTTVGASQAWGALNADVEWTHQSPRDADTGTLLVRRAREHGRAGVAFDGGAWRAGADAVASGARFDSAVNSPGSRMGGYALLSLYAAWRFMPEWTASARINNATDKRYEIAQGYNTAPRQWVLSIDGRWR
jgi:vitamin B12 transporter